jgi:hypothetical protein
LAFKAQGAATAAAASWGFSVVDTTSSGQQGLQLQQRLVSSMDFACSTLYGICQASVATGNVTVSSGGGSRSSSSIGVGSSNGGGSNGSGTSSSSGHVSSLTGGELQVKYVVLVAHSLQLLGQTMEAVMPVQQAEAVQAAEQLLLQLEVTVRPGGKTRALDCMAAGWQWLKVSLQELSQEPTAAAVAEIVVTAAVAAAAECATHTDVKHPRQRLLQQCSSTVDNMARTCLEHYSRLMQCNNQEQQQQGNSAATVKTQRKAVKPGREILKLAKQLQQLGAVVISTLPLPYCCNNPSCKNLDGFSEQELVAGSRCSGCKVARYCSRECQAEHWGGAAGHKALCKRLRAAASTK